MAPKIEITYDPDSGRGYDEEMGGAKLRRRAMAQQPTADRRTITDKLLRRS